MSKTLSTTVHVVRKDGSVVRYLAGEKPSAADAKLITNPDVWADDPEPQEKPSTEDTAK